MEMSPFRVRRVIGGDEYITGRAVDFDGEFARTIKRNEMRFAPSRAAPVRMRPAPTYTLAGVAAAV